MTNGPAYFASPSATEKKVFWRWHLLGVDSFVGVRGRDAQDVSSGEGALGNGVFVVKLWADGRRVVVVQDLDGDATRRYERSVGGDDFQLVRRDALSVQLSRDVELTVFLDLESSLKSRFKKS